MLNPVVVSFTSKKEQATIFHYKEKAEYMLKKLRKKSPWHKFKIQTIDI
jgi:hypothetical protein